MCNILVDSYRYERRLKMKGKENSLKTLFFVSFTTQISKISLNGQFDFRFFQNALHLILYAVIPGFSKCFMNFYIQNGKIGGYMNFLKYSISASKTNPEFVFRTLKLLKVNERTPPILFCFLFSVSIWRKIYLHKLKSDFI